MDSRVYSRYGGRRQASVLVVTTLWAILLLALAPGVRGESTQQPGIAHDPTGAPYVSGELLVAYEQGTPEKAEEAVVNEAGARTLENPPGEELRLISIPSQASEGESDLEQELQNIEDEPQVEAADYNYIREVTFTPDDPRFEDQWGLTKTGFPDAWSSTKGRGAKIAVVDSGVDQRHPDIGNIVAQKDFVEHDAVADDDADHGTLVTGIAGALTNNGRGVAGGCPRCGLLIAKVVGPAGVTTDSKLVKGIGWSVNHGADVINLSLGDPGKSSVLKATVNDASANGAVVVAAAGNERTTTRQYPAAYRKAIAVSATNRKDKLARFSSRGKWVDLAAPGTNILSTLAGGGYSQESGTSLSAPFVSALAGLLASQDMPADQIRHRMQSTATDLGPTGEDPRFGHGRIDAATAVR
ncbi:MAG TPA: S8 family serine peptidase [Rubrobacter sp.]|nr:S8 family serine peptidase [Rubrobacter sp.]